MIEVNEVLSSPGVITEFPEGPKAVIYDLDGTLVSDRFI